MVPSGWTMEFVGNVFDVQLGKMLNKVAKEQFPQLQYLGNTNVKWGYFELSELKRMFFNDREKEKFTILDGDILMCEGGEVGRCAIWDSGEKDIFYQKALHRLRSKGTIFPEYFQNYMKFIAETKLLDDFTTRTSIAHLTREKLLKLPIKAPPLQEQRKIAQIFSTWDKAISATEALVANSQQQKKSLMQQLLTGKKRFAGFKGEWEIAKLSQVAIIIMGSSPKSADYNETGTGLPLIQGNADIKNRRSCPRIFTSQVTKECFIGDILLSVRAPVGTVAISKHNARIGRGISSIKAKNGYSHEFLYQWLLYFEPKWERLSQGSTFEAVNSHDIKSLHINIPSSQNEQQKIASILIVADQEIDTLQQKCNYLKQEKKALMQQLLTGKRRVNV
ncbi:MAG: type I restriction enzyme, S subunit [Methyloprofundus sp.]|nr:MAG: type I restriction enzyme, S subunit [Methyloprofundus sp.]